MNKIIHPWINLASNNLRTVAEAISGAKPADPGDLWRRTLANQARFINECTDDVLVQLARSRLLMAEQFKQISAHTEHVASLMAHAAVRTVAIAAHARRESRDRRIFPLPLPDERRFEAPTTDRRKLRSGNQHPLKV